MQETANSELKRISFPRFWVSSPLALCFHLHPELVSNTVQFNPRIKTTKKPHHLHNIHDSRLPASPRDDSHLIICPFFVPANPPIPNTRNRGISLARQRSNNLPFKNLAFFDSIFQHQLI
jgi:hypothetical protein